MSGGRYELTVRHGPRVSRERYPSLDEAMDAAERQVERIRAEGPLEEVSGFRDYEPGERVHARLELSTGGVLRGREAGLDVMGNGALVPYAGVIRKRRLETDGSRSPFDAVREALTG